MNIALDLHSFSQSLVEHMLNGSIQGFVIAALVILAIRVGARKSAATRFVALFATLVATAGLSFLSFSGTGTPASHGSGLSFPSSWAFNLFCLWALGVVFGLVRIVVGLREVSRLRRGSQPIDIGALDPTLQETLRQSGLTRSVTIRVSEQLRVPTAIGFFRPAVLLPAWAVNDLSAVELNAVLIHELAHLRRWDDWTKLAEKLIGALLFFHPAVWWIQARLGLEREIACDDLVLASSGDARCYAECLISVAERSRMRTGLALALAAISRVRQTSIRIAQILDPHRSDTKTTSMWKPAVAMMTALSAVTLAAGPLVPTLVSFHDNAPALRTASAHVVPAVYRPEARPKVVPASFELKAQPSTSTLPKRQSVERIRESNHSQIALTTAKARPQPRTVRASLTQDPTRASTVLVVFESRQFDSSGYSRLTICIWRFTPDQKGATANKGFTSKSI